MTTHHLSQGISMSVRITSALMLLGLLSLTGCAPRTDVRSFTSAQLVTGSMDEETDHHALTSNQLAALSNWIKAGEWSGLSADIPDQPSMQVALQNADGQSDRLAIYTRDDGNATAYLYHAQRLVPLRRHLSSADLAALNTILNEP
jgi:hypothetical protein